MFRVFLAKTRPILSQTIADAGLPYTTGKLRSTISVGTSRSFITITGKDPDPVLAAQIANTTAQAFIDDFRRRQFTEIASFQASLDQFGIQNDPSIVAAQASAISTLSIVEQADPPGSPSSPNTKLNIIWGVGLGLLVAGLLIILLEYLNDRIRSAEEVKAITGLDALGSVLSYEPADRHLPLTIVDEEQADMLSESYKFLQTNIEFASMGMKGTILLLVTSSKPGEGKTTTAANLAISVANEGKSVILVDADLRKPAIHRVFDIDGGNQQGLTHVLLGHNTLDEVLSTTRVRGLRILPSGPLPPDAAQVLRTAGMRKLMQQLKNRADLVIFDSPPLLSVTDPMLLAPMVDGVILVVDAQGTPRETVRQGATILRQAMPGFSGTVLNKVKRGGGGYYYNYYYYSSSSNNGTSSGHRGRFHLPTFLRRALRRIRLIRVQRRSGGSYASHWGRRNAKDGVDSATLAPVTARENIAGDGSSHPEN